MLPSEKRLFVRAAVLGLLLLASGCATGESSAPLTEDLHRSYRDREFRMGLDHKFKHSDPDLGVNR